MMMRNTTKKITAALVALLMMIQIIPTMAETYSSGMIVGGAEGYREELEVVASKGTYVLVGQTLELDANKGYNPTWSSGDETIATIDESGTVTALAAGEVTITATEGDHTASTVVTVIDPNPLVEQAAHQQQPEETDGQEQTSVEKVYMIIVINAQSSRYVYDGEEHTLADFVATSNETSFDASKVKVNGEIGITATDCGTYQFILEESSFSYDDPNVVASFMVNNGWMKITPAQVTVAANPVEKQAGETDPELTATVTGLFGEDTIEYSFERYPGEEAGDYIIDVIGEQKQGNYKVQFVPGVMTITEAPVELEPLNVWVRSLHPAGESVEYGMEITLEAEVTGAAEGEYTIQWQYSADMQNWEDIPGANSLTYTFIANGETVTYAWRAVADRIQ